MENQIAYAFDSAQLATRFLNRLKSGAIAGVRARLYRGSRSVLASYQVESAGGFDRTCVELDDLAASLEGREIPVV